MAGISRAITTISTVDATSFATGAFSGSPQRLMLVYALGSDCVVPNPVVTDAVVQPNQVGFTKVTSVQFGPSIHTLYLYVANRLVPNTANRNVTADYTPTTATGSILSVLYVTGMSKAGPAAIRQVATNPNNAAGTPTATFPFAPLVTNTYVASMANLTNPNNSAGPYSSTPGFPVQTMDTTGFATPTIGWSAYAKTGGESTALLTWAPSATAWGTLAVELDTSEYTSRDAPQLEAGIGV